MTASGEVTEPATLSPDAKSSTPKPIGLGTKLAYGAGAAAYGIKENGFSYFLLIFYSQVIGVEASLVGIALMIALIVDAISDPIVGYWSDNLNSRLGRRHPFMYASALPVSLSFFFLWNPPAGLSEQTTFFYLVILAIIIRTFITFYETPSSALGTELTSDYDERSSLFSFRFFFAWVGGNTMSVLNFFILFPVFYFTATNGTEVSGQFNRDAYTIYGLVAGILIFLAILVSAIGTHSRIPYLRKPPAKQTFSLKKVFQEIFQTLSDKSFFALFFAAMFGAVASGLTASLAFYFTTYFWGFSSVETGFITMGVFASAILGSFLAPIVTRTIGKKKGALIIGVVAFLGSPTPIMLRLINVMPPNENPLTFWIYFFANLFDTALIICYQILVFSMMADLVEAAELKTGRRSEGIFSSATTFIRKSVQGIGLMAATAVLALAGLEKGMSPAEVSDETVFRLGLFYVPILLSIWGAMMACVAFYKLDRAGHEANLAALKSR